MSTGNSANKFKFALMERNSLLAEKSSECRPHAFPTLTNYRLKFPASEADQALPLPVCTLRAFLSRLVLAFLTL
jgi:hypothetical protein